ncbi:MAG TPA: helix-turn-helix domain-containing protein [Nitrospirae bacterium]|nr:helix-turn-helix domain-containing protein [Nitrospirota bacterium]
MSKKNKHIGSSFDDFLKAEGVLEEVEASAIKKVIAMKIQEAMKQKKLTKAALARKMNTSRSALDRLLDPENKSVTLQTLVKAANALGKQVTVSVK